MKAKILMEKLLIKLWWFRDCLFDLGYKVTFMSRLGNGIWNHSRTCQSVHYQYCRRSNQLMLQQRLWRPVTGHCLRDVSVWLYKLITRHRGPALHWFWESTGRLLMADTPTPEHCSCFLLWRIERRITREWNGPVFLLSINQGLRLGRLCLGH